MPSRSSHRQDPYPDIAGWDDGYEYIQPGKPAAPPSSAPYFPPPPSNAGTARDLPRPPIGRDTDPYVKPRYPSPVSAANTFSAPRQRRNATSPPRRSRRVSPSPDRRGRESRETRYPPKASQGRPERPLTRTATHPLRSESARERPRRAVYSRSPSPVRPRRNRDEASASYMDDYRPRADSPPRRARTAPRRGYSRSPSPTRYGARPQARPRRAETYRAPAPPPTTRADGVGRPELARSKSTSARAKRFSGLSPRWQKAATAAFQAGSATAYSLRSEPGAWKGDKGLRVATAAFGAGAVDAFGRGGSAEKPSGSSSRSKSAPRKSGQMEALGGALGGLIIDQIVARSAGGKHKS